MYWFAVTEVARGMPETAINTESAASIRREMTTDIQNRPVDEVSDSTDGGLTSATSHFVSKPLPGSSSATVSQQTLASGQSTMDNEAQLPQPSEAVYQGGFM